MSFHLFFDRFSHHVNLEKSTCGSRIRPKRKVLSKVGEKVDLRLQKNFKMTFLFGQKNFKMTFLFGLVVTMWRMVAWGLLPWRSCTPILS